MSGHTGAPSHPAWERGRGSPDRRLRAPIHRLCTHLGGACHRQSGSRMRRRAASSCCHKGGAAARLASGRPPRSSVGGARRESVEARRGRDKRKAGERSQAGQSRETRTKPAAEQWLAEECKEPTLRAQVQQPRAERKGRAGGKRTRSGQGASGRGRRRSGGETRPRSQME